MRYFTIYVKNNTNTVFNVGALHRRFVNIADKMTKVVNTILDGEASPNTSLNNDIKMCFQIMFEEPTI